MMEGKYLLGALVMYLVSKIVLIFVVIEYRENPSVLYAGLIAGAIIILNGSALLIISGIKRINYPYTHDLEEIIE
jgi:hypothetical protein